MTTGENPSFVAGAESPFFTLFVSGVYRTNILYRAQLANFGECNLFFMHNSSMKFGKE